MEADLHAIVNDRCASLCPPIESLSAPYIDPLPAATLRRSFPVFYSSGPLRSQVRSLRGRHSP